MEMGVGLRSVIFLLAARVKKMPRSKRMKKLLAASPPEFPVRFIN